MARTDLEQLVYQMSADIKSLERANQRALGVVDGGARKIQQRYDKLGEEIGRGLGRASVAAGVALAAMATVAIKAASDAEETANAFNVTFGDLADKAREFAKAYSNDVGRSFEDLQERMATAQGVLTGLGISAKDALPIVEQLVRRSVDFASLKNVSDGQAFEAFLSAITGETEPMKKFGVVINETATKAELLNQGFKGNASNATEAAKAYARVNLLLKGTTDAQDDAIETADGLANQQKRAASEFHNAAVALGKELLPAAIAATKATTDLVKEFNGLPAGVKMGGLALLGLVAAGGPIAGAISGLVKLIEYAKAARLALAGMGAASAAAGAGGAAGAGIGAATGAGLAGAAAVVGGAAVMIGGAMVVASESTIQAARQRAMENLTKAASRDLELALKASEPARGQSGFQKGQAMIQAELLRRAGTGAGAGEAKTAADRAAEAAVAGLGGFALPTDLKTATGGTGGGQAARAASARIERSAKLIADAKDAELAAQLELTGDIQRQAELETRRVDQETAERNRAIQADLKAKDITAAAAKEATDLNNQTATARKAAILREADLAMQERALRQDEALAGYHDQVLALTLERASTAAQQNDLEEQILVSRQKQETERQSLDLAAQLARGEIGKVLKGELEAGLRQQQAAERRNFNIEAVERVQRELNARAQSELELQIDTLSSQASLARSSSERRDIELRILRLQQQLERAKLEELRDSQTASPQQRADARSRLGALPEIQANQTQDVLRSTMGPLEAWVDSAIMDAGRVRDAFQEIGVRGLDNLNQGLADSIVNARSWREALSSAIRQVASDFITLALRAGEASLFGGGGGGGFLGSLLGVATKVVAPSAPQIFRAAIGTDSAPGGPMKVGEHGEEVINVPRGTQVIPNQVLRSLGRTGQGARSAPIMNVDASIYAPNVGKAEVAALQQGQQEIVRHLRRQAKQEPERFVALSQAREAGVFGR